MTSKFNILIVDDEPRICDSLRLLLSNQGYEIQTANSGEAALECLSLHKIDVALLDIVLPDMDGHEVMDCVKKVHPDAHIILMTGHASVESAVAALKKGAYDYLRKPFEFEELLKTVQNALDQKSLKREKETIDEKLELSEDRYRQLVQNSPDIIYTLDGFGNFTFISDVVERLIGYKADQLIGKHYTRIIYAEDIEKARRAFDERRTGNHATSDMELRLNVYGEKDQFKFYEVRHVTIELKSTGVYDKPVTGGGEFSGTYVVARDISDRKQLEAQLQQAQKMEALGTLAGGIAHDFNNILMGIQGYTSLLLSRIDATHPYYEKLKHIEKYAHSGAGLTQQLLGFARGGRYDVKPIDLNELIHKTAQMFARTKKDIVLHEDYQKDIFLVDADKGQIEQVLVNLYVNSWQAMPGGGDVYLRTENTTLIGDNAVSIDSRPGNHVKISIRDTGVGMDEATRKRVFDPFFTTKEMGRGTGLGLASSYGIIKNHGGHIDVHSKKGIGATFNIYLPASDKEVKEEKEKTKDDCFLGTETVLLVDDEATILDVAREMLEELGYKVLSAGSGKEAIALYLKNMAKIDIVILDMIMSGMGGGETFDRMKEINPNIKTLLSSGYSISGRASEILKRGCNGFIQKPFDMGQLSRKIREILD